MDSCRRCHRSCPMGGAFRKGEGPPFLGTRLSAWGVKVWGVHETPPPTGKRSGLCVSLLPPINGVSSKFAQMELIQKKNEPARGTLNGAGKGTL